MKHINVITLCSGYDSQCLALKRLKENYSDFDFNLVAWAEFDPESKQPIEKQPAVIAHNALFPEYKGRNMGDMTKCDWSSIKEHIDLLFYSVPCQSLSQCGLQHGMKKGSGTRSSIIWNVLDVIDILKPKYLVLENVKALVSDKFIKDFNDWQNQLEKRGYTNYWNILNSKDFGCPQNRERVFLVSILGENKRFYFPKPFKLEKKLKDVLEQYVDEKFYLSEEKNSEFIQNIKIEKPLINHNEPMAVSYTRDAKGKVIRRHLNNIVSTIKATHIDGSQDIYIAIPNINSYRIRKLTTKERFRLMGLTDDDINKIQAFVINKRERQKLAGNSIVVDVLYHLFRKMFIETGCESEQLNLF